MALVVTIILAGVGTLLGLSFTENLSSVTLPNVANNAPQGLGTILTGVGILDLLAPFVGVPSAVPGTRERAAGAHRGGSKK